LKLKFLIFAYKKEISLSVISAMTEQFMILKPCISQQADARNMLRSTFSHDSKIVIITSTISLICRIIPTLIMVSIALNGLRGFQSDEFLLFMMYAAFTIAIISLQTTAIINSSKLRGLGRIFDEIIDDSTISKIISLGSSRKIALGFCILATCIEFFIIEMIVVYAMSTAKGDMTGAGIALVFLAFVIFIKMALGIFFLFMTIPKYFHSKEVMLAIECLSRECELARPLAH